MGMIRHYDHDTPFGAWLRANKDKIPSNGVETGTTANDVDFVIHCWKRKNTGEQIKAITQVEIKTRCGEVAFQQMEAFSTLSAFAGVRDFKDAQYRFYGVCFLLLSHTRPDNSDTIVWKRFPVQVKTDVKEKLVPSAMLIDRITEAQLIGILTSDLHPISLRKFRPGWLHHGRKSVVVTEMTELGFPVEKVVHKRW